MREYLLYAWVITSVERISRDYPHYENVDAVVGAEAGTYKEEQENESELAIGESLKQKVLPGARAPKFQKQVDSNEHCDLGLSIISYELKDF